MQYWANVRRQIGGPSTPPNPPKPEDPKPEDPKPEDPQNPQNPPPPPPPTDDGVANIWEQCGGRGWRGPTTCAQGLVCQPMGPWYSQCRIG